MGRCLCEDCWLPNHPCWARPQPAGGPSSATDAIRERECLTMSGAGGKVLARLHEGGLAPAFDEPRPAPQGPRVG